MDAWLPHLIEPGSVLVLNNAADDGSASSFCALLHCPFCERLVVVTEQQFSGEAAVTCGAADCPATFFLQDGMPVLTTQN
ncbi:MAG: hypothetical protein ACRD2E_03610 [Terriglobales bacterium]